MEWSRINNRCGQRLALKWIVSRIEKELSLVMEIQRRISFGFRLEVSGFIFMYIFIFFSLSLSLSLSVFIFFFFFFFCFSFLSFFWLGFGFGSDVWFQIRLEIQTNQKGIACKLLKFEWELLEGGEGGRGRRGRRGEEERRRGGEEEKERGRERGKKWINMGL